MSDGVKNVQNYAVATGLNGGNGSSVRAWARSNNSDSDSNSYRAGSRTSVNDHVSGGLGSDATKGISNHKSGNGTNKK